MIRVSWSKRSEFESLELEKKIEISNVENDNGNIRSNLNQQYMWLHQCYSDNVNTLVLILKLGRSAYYFY